MVSKQFLEGDVFADDAIGAQFDAELENIFDLRVENVCRDDAARDTIPHHPSGLRSRIDECDAVALERQVVGSREPGRASADNGDVRGIRLFREAGPGSEGVRDGKVANQLLDAVDGQRTVFCLAVAVKLAGMLTDAPANCWKRIVLQDFAPGKFERFGGGASICCVLSDGNQPFANICPAGTAIHAGRGFGGVMGAGRTRFSCVGGGLPNDRFFNFFEQSHRAASSREASVC